MKKVLVVPWGNPFEWRDVTYVYEENGKETIMKDIPCTLPILKYAIKPDEIIIIVLDTLANVVNKHGESCISKRDFSSYKEVRDDVEEHIKYFIKEKLGCNFDEIKLVIAPGVGVFGNIRVEGEILDYYHYIVWELAKNLPTEDMTVYLDLTHGINFMPALTYRALVNLLGLASYLKDVWFKVLNSEPYPRGIPQDKIKKLRLRIRIVEDREVKPKPILSLLNDNDKFNRWNAFISSIANGFPLVFATFYPKIEEVKNEIDKMLREFYEKVAVKDQFVKRQPLNPNFKTLSKLYYLLKILNTNKMFRNLPKQELNLNELKMISETLFNKLPRIGIIVEEQIKDLERRLMSNGKPVSRLRGKGWKPLIYYFPSSSGGDFIIDENKAVRNFIAHSGFEYNVTMVKEEFDKIKFKYKSKEKCVIPYSIESLRFRLKEGDKK